MIKYIVKVNKGINFIFMFGDIVFYLIFNYLKFYYNILLLRFLF